MDRHSFLDDELTQNAVYRLIMVIGEAASQVSDERRELLPTVPWKQMVGMRHKLVHHYFRIDAHQIWDVVEHHLAGLVQAIESYQTDANSK